MKQPKIIPNTVTLGPLPQDPNLVWYCMDCELTVTPNIDPDLNEALCPHCNQDLIWWNPKER